MLKLRTATLLRRGCRAAYAPTRGFSALTGSGDAGDDAAPMVLTREYIYGALYAPDGGYFTTPTREVLHAPPQTIDFPSLWGQMEYRSVVSKLYKARREAWLTPVEVFAPHYSHALAKYMLHSPLVQSPMRVFEIGGGAGTNALHILNYLRTHAPDVYEKTQYTLIEISPVMAERQRQRVLSEHPHVCTVLNTDILTFADQHAVVSEPCFFLAMEVLDNLPHDKVSLRHGKWCETVVRAAPGDGLQLVEDVRPVSDPLVRQTLEYFGCDLPLRVQYRLNNALAQRVRSLFGKNEIDLDAAFIPTGAMQLLNTLRSSFPRHHLIAADFDELPAPTLSATSSVKALHHPLSPTATSAGTLCAGNAPLVASKTSGETEDHDTYLVAGGVADIFFATDFARLKKAYCKALGRKADEVSVVKSAAFLKEFADLKQTRTMTGYNPLLEDYTNTSFILS
ncbi:hypothetical protein ATCC90586_007938 [Pythium insidiosum]|nr:hypothetical protein ATCC90586_007938 [Pythium insidiosum]